MQKRSLKRCVRTIKTFPTALTKVKRPPTLQSGTNKKTSKKTAMTRSRDFFKIIKWTWETSRSINLNVQSGSQGNYLGHKTQMGSKQAKLLLVNKILVPKKIWYKNSIKSLFSTTHGVSKGSNTGKRSLQRLLNCKRTIYRSISLKTEALLVISGQAFFPYWNLAQWLKQPNKQKSGSN